jgi:virginiamycin B lyase
MKRVSLCALVALEFSMLLMGQSGPTIQEFGGLNAGARPGAITAGPDCALWLAEVGNIGRITTSGVVKEFSLATLGTGSQAVGEPFGITAAPDGALWFTLGNGLNRITTTSVVTGPSGTPVDRCQGDLRELIVGPDRLLWAINSPSGIAQFGPGFTDVTGCIFSGSPLRIAAGPDGNIWSTECCAGKIIRLTLPWVLTLAPNFTEFPIPDANSQPMGITAGPDGALWFTDQNGKIGTISTSGKITEFPVPIPGSAPGDITAGPDGALWFTDPPLNQIGRITTAGVITEFPIPNPETKQTHQFKSHPLFSDPSAALAGKKVEVLMDPGKPQRYFVDLAPRADSSPSLEGQCKHK